MIYSRLWFSLYYFLTLAKLRKVSINEDFSTCENRRKREVVREIFKTLTHLKFINIQPDFHIHTEMHDNFVA